MARHAVPRLHHTQLRLLLKADRLAHPASGRKPALGLGVDGADHVPLQHDPVYLVLRIHLRNRGEQRQGIGVQRVVEQSLHVRILHKPSQIPVSYTHLKDFRESGDIPVRGSGNYASDEQKEIARLRRELRDAQDALDVLKKAINILGK